MGRLLKWVFYLVIILGLGLLAYAYVGPIVDKDFTPESNEIRIPVELDAG